MTIKLWKDNLLKNEYEMEVSDIIRRFKTSKYYEYYNIDRWLSVYIMDELKSSFDVKDFELLRKEYFKEASNGKIK